MKAFFVVFLVLSFFSIITVTYCFAYKVATSYSLGVGLSFINILLLYWAWKMIFQKKLIALAVSVIVFKYAILGVIIYYSIRSGNFSAQWMTVGFSILLPSVLGYAFIKTRLE